MYLCMYVCMYALTDVYDCYSGMVDTIFADVAQPDQARIVALNAQYFLKNGTPIHTYIHTYIHTVHAFRPG